MRLMIFYATCRTNFMAFKEIAQGAFLSLHIVDCQRMHDKARPHLMGEIPGHVHSNYYLMIILTILGERDKKRERTKRNDDRK